MANSYNPEISNQIKEEGGTVIYSAGNIIIASEISEELFRELIKSPYIEDLEVLPLKRYAVTQKLDAPTLEIDNEIVAFDDLSDEGNNDDDENQPGGGTIPSGAS